MTLRSGRAALDTASLTGSKLRCFDTDTDLRRARPYLLIECAGASASDLDNPIQRHWRDVNAAARHVSLDVQAINTLLGQQLFGMTPVGLF